MHPSCGWWPTYKRQTASELSFKTKNKQEEKKKEKGGGVKKEQNRTEKERKGNESKGEEGEIVAPDLEIATHLQLSVEPAPPRSNYGTVAPTFAFEW